MGYRFFEIHRLILSKWPGRYIGIKDPVAAPTLQGFATEQFLPFAEKHFGPRQKTLWFYENGVNLLAHKPVARLPLTAISTGDIGPSPQGKKRPVSPSPA